MAVQDNLRMNDETSTPVHQPHDKFFKEAFGRLDLSRSFFRSYLPPHLADAVDWTTLQLEPGSFVDERLVGRATDLLYSARVRGEPVFLYFLFEHQSTVDPAMPFRLLGYMVRIWEVWRKRAKPGQKPPCILPLVLHQGAGPWTVSTRFLDGLAVPEGLCAEVAPCQPDFEHILVDLSRVPLAQMQGDLLLQLTLTLMKAVVREELGIWLERYGPALGELLGQPDRAGLARVLLKYALSVDAKQPSTVEEFVVKLNDQTVKSDVMSIAEQLMQRGRQEGRQEGLQEGRQLGRQEGERAGAARWTKIGLIHAYQEMLGFPVNSLEELGAKHTPALEALLRELQTRARSR